jgi:hypothetical protein
MLGRLTEDALEKRLEAVRDANSAEQDVDMS